MAARTIGALSFTGMNGGPGGSGEMLEISDRIGVDGQRARKVGSRIAEASIQTVAFVATASIAATLNSYLAVKGTVVTIVDAHNVSWANCTILDVRWRPEACIHEGTAKVRITAWWVIK